MIPAMDPKVADVFDTFADDAKAGLLRLRRLVFEIAADLPKVGHVAEVLRWGPRQSPNQGRLFGLGCQRRGASRSMPIAKPR